MNSIIDREIVISSKEYNDILNIQQEILNKIASNANPIDILTHLCFLSEELLPNSVSSIMLLSEDKKLLNILSAPSIPQKAQDRLSNLKVEKGGGSCSNAVLSEKPQFIKNTFTDKRWESIRSFAIDFNLCACWSFPIKGTDNKVIGTFALSSFEHRSPNTFHKKLLQICADTVKVVLKKRDSENKIELFSKAKDNAMQGILVTNSKNEIIDVNKSFLDIYGYDEDEVLGQNPKIFSSNDKNKKFYKKMWKKIDKKHQFCGEFINLTKDKKEIVQWLNISKIHDGDNTKYLAIFTDVTKLKESQKKLEDMIYLDTLTSLYNKNYIERVLKFKSKKTMIFLDVNNFSYINTAYGFELGDKLLIKISKLLRDTFPNDIVARINSDEFLLLFDKKVIVEDKILKIRDYFYNNSITIDSINLHISFSYGSAYGRKSLLKNCVLALKQSKETGQNNLFMFQKSKNQIKNLNKETFTQLNNQLYKALKEDRVIPFFQGIRDNKTKEIIKFETLARLDMDDKIISPSNFIEVASLSGLLPTITRIIIDKSFKEMSKNSYKFSINITEDDLNHNYLIDYLSKKLTQYNISADRIILEILENISIKNRVSHIVQLKKLKKLGFKLAIDDFGSENSNFERVLDLDIDFLKIDAQYIKDIYTNKKSYEITKAIVFFANNSNIKTIAEFTHNKKVQKIVEELGISFSQGYYFSEPSIKPIAIISKKKDREIN